MSKDRTINNKNPVPKNKGFFLTAAGLFFAK
jgi:hypothetical protein